MNLTAIVLGQGLEHWSPGRMVRVAEIALTTLHGASQLAAAAPGFGEPFDVVSVCEQLADLGLNDDWQPPHLPLVPKARPADEPWSPPAMIDALRDEPARLVGDGVIAVLGLHRLVAIEEAVRTAPPGATVTAALVTAAPDELSPLARLVVTELRDGLRTAFPAGARPRLQVIHDDAGVLAAATGVRSFSDATESAIRVRAGRIVARADGYGACYAAAAS
jgi:hypothetical protein